MKYQTWLAGSLVRQFPRSVPGRHRTVRLSAVRGQQVSFQACIRVADSDVTEIALSAKAPSGIHVQIRRVGCVPVPHHNTLTPDAERDGIGHIPGYVPDVLFPEQTGRAIRGEVLAFWVTLTIAPNVRAGDKTIDLVFDLPGKARSELQAVVQVAPITLAPRKDFHVTHWFYADAIADYYRTDPFSDAFWPLCEAYMRNYARHGNDTIYVPVFTPPLDGLKRPTQLLRVVRAGKDRYRFDWSAVERWIQLARHCGLTHFEWGHLFSQWGATSAVRVYEGQGEDESRLLWPSETLATDGVYRKFLQQYLRELEPFLQSHKLMGCSFFHVSDEPTDQHLPSYGTARELLREYAPWMKVFDALSDIEFARQGMTDLPVANIAKAREFKNAGVTHWAYFCCGPRESYINRLMDTPLIKVRMLGWLLYRFGARGFLHWGYNYWQRRNTRQLIDPFTVSDACAWPDFPYGDTFVVYPGPAGPYDSIRWEIFAESMQDYALLQTLDVDPKSRLLAELRDYNNFPKTEAWLNRTLHTLIGAR